MGPRTTELLARVPEEDRVAVLEEAWLARNMQGGRLCDAVEAEVVRYGQQGSEWYRRDAARGREGLRRDGYNVMAAPAEPGEWYGLGLAEVQADYTPALRRVEDLQPVPWPGRCEREGREGRCERLVRWYLVSPDGYECGQLCNEHGRATVAEIDACTGLRGWRLVAVEVLGSTVRETGAGYGPAANTGTVSPDALRLYLWLEQVHDDEHEGSRTAGRFIDWWCSNDWDEELHGQHPELTVCGLADELECRGLDVWDDVAAMGFELPVYVVNRRRPWWTMTDVAEAVRRECGQWNGRGYAPVVVGRRLYSGPGGAYVLSSQDQGTELGRQWAVWEWLANEATVRPVRKGYQTARGARWLARALADGGETAAMAEGRAQLRDPDRRAAAGAVAEVAGGGEWERYGRARASAEVSPVVWLR